MAKQWQKLALTICLAIVYVINTLLVVAMLTSSSAMQSFALRQVVNKGHKQMYLTANLELTPTQPPPSRGTVVLTTTNQSFLGFVINLLRSIRNTGARPNVTVVVEDQKSYKGLKNNKYPGLNIIKPEFSTLKKKRKAYKYGTDNYKLFINRRPKYILQFLKDGFDVFFIDADSFWFNDPFPYFEGDFDVAFYKDLPLEVYNAGCAYYKPTKRTLKLLKEWVRVLETQTRLTQDQDVMNVIIEEKRIPGLRVKQLSHDNFANGNTYFFNDKKCRRETNNLAVLHASWSGDHKQKSWLFTKCKLWLKKALV